ncbi:hypothetical protein Bca4012_079061 [Brassica carinata]
MSPLVLAGVNHRRFETQEKLIIVGTIHHKPKPDHILNDESDSLLQRLILRF